MGVVPLGIRLHAGRRRVSLRQGVAQVGSDGSVGCLNRVVPRINMGSHHVSDGEVGCSASSRFVEALARCP